MTDNLLDKDIPKSADLRPQLTGEELTIRFVAKVVAVVLIVIVVSMVGCTMQGHMYEASVLEAEAVLKAESRKASEADAKVRIARIESMERMINNGANPIAVRCMDKGWSNDNTCMAVGIAIGKITPTDGIEE